MGLKRGRNEKDHRMSMIPYGRQSIDEDDIAVVVEVLRSDWLTTGPKIEEFENKFAGITGSKYAVAVSSGTAALHCAMYALGIGAEDEVIVPAMTFAATANCVVYQGGTPVFCDIEAETLLIDSTLIEPKISDRTKAIIAVDYAGQPCDYEKIYTVAERHGLVVVADACHSLGATYKGRQVGSLAELNIFSFHPVKHITTGEGGMITTNNKALSDAIRNFRNHGITVDHHQREKKGTWFYAMEDIGYNYRMTDFQCALGTSQLKKLPNWVQRRREIAARYDEAFDRTGLIKPLHTRDDCYNSYHLYVVRFESDRAAAFASLRSSGIGVNVHYIPVYLHPYYRKHFGTHPGLCPSAEEAYEKIISLPMYPALTDEDVEKVINQCLKLI